MKLSITKNNFLDWYFESGQDSENLSIKEQVLNSILDQMYKVGFGSVSVQELFDNCNQDAIRLSFTEQSDDGEIDYDIELSDLESYTIELI